MARYSNDIETTLSRAQARAVISSYLKQEGFTYGSQRGETVWRKGSGGLVAPQFIRAEPGDGTVHIEAWLSRYVVAPGLYGGEQGLTGLYGWAVKSMLRNRVRELEARLAGKVPEARAQAPAPATPPRLAKPAGWYLDPVRKHAWRFWDGSRWTVETSDDEYAPVTHALPPAP